MTLIIVLLSLALLTVIVVAYLSEVGTELRSTKRYADSLEAKLLSQTAVNLAIAQITQGTSGVDASGNTLAWASQPGMIRTYDTSGNPSAYYKLYSWDANLTGTGAFNPTLTAEKVPTTWSTQPAIFTDLNDPITLAGTSYYPIVDPAALSGTTGSTVTGFSLTSAPIASGSNPDQVPMPVKWLYVLADGTLVPPVAQTNPNQVTVAGATTANPITGRIAFWTDDDTCKININTASEGTYWDTPRIVNSTEAGTGANSLSADQPAQNEFQRYPGHPAMTSLSTVLPLTAEQIYSLIPRVVGSTGSSMEGTVSVNGGSTGSVTLQPDTDRLFPSVDEMLFQPFPVSGIRQVFNPSSPNPAPFNKSNLSTYQFFLTAHSRAPDLNLFNLPRVCMWPISATNDSAHRSAYDQLAAFCSTINTLPFYFQRSSSVSSTADLPATGSTSGVGRNRMLMEYLRYLLGQKIPGFGGDFRDKYNYTPTGGTAQEIDQILTEIFDYIRCINLEDRQVTSPFTPETPYQSGNAVYVTGGSGQVVPIVDTTMSTGTATYTRGFGRMNMVQGAMLQFVGAADNTTDTNIPTGYVRVEAILNPVFFDPSVGYATDIFDFDVNMTGMQNFTWQSWNNLPQTTTSQTTPHAITPQPVVTVNMNMPFEQNPAGAGPVPAQTLPVPPVEFTYGSSGYPNYADREYGGTMGFPELAHSKVQTPNAYPYVTPMVTANTSQYRLDQAGLYTVIMPKGSTFQFSGGTVTVNIYPPGVTSGTPVQSVDLVFPSGTFPVPQLAPSSVGGENFQTLLTFSWSASAGPRLNPENGALNANQIAQEDVVRAIVPATGDMRMMAARAAIRATDSNYSSFYGPHINYTSSSLFDAHNLRDGSNCPYYGATGGQLVPVNYSNQYSSGNPVYNYATDTTGIASFTASDSSVVPNTVANGVRMIDSTGTINTDGLYGDWDTGVGSIEDGPYINKADEGDYEISSSNNVSYFSYGGIQVPGPSLFSPNRMVPSPGVMGSLSSGVLQNHPWQTLLFCPNPAGGTAHPGFGISTTGTTTGVGPAAWPPYKTPPDHLLMDLFNMPVVEPYAISEPFSTAGRINMNYQMVPFTYINRTTALQAILKAEKVIAIANSAATNYKAYPIANPAPANIRLSIDPVETLKGFDQRFNPQNYGLSMAPDIFRSPSEICDIYMVPQGQTYAGMSGFWASNASPSYLLTGDNCRERPYATIYPRLTTKSNTYTVYVRVQGLQKVKGNNSPPTTWTEGTDVISGEYRGYQTVERYVDPSSLPSGVDYANSSIYTSIPTADVLGRAYKFRVDEAKQFSP